MAIVEAAIEHFATQRHGADLTDALEASRPVLIALSVSVRTSLMRAGSNRVTRHVPPGWKLPGAPDSFSAGARLRPGGAGLAATESSLWDKDNSLLSHRSRCT